MHLLAQPSVFMRSLPMMANTSKLLGTVGPHQPPRQKPQPWTASIPGDTASLIGLCTYDLFRSIVLKSKSFNDLMKLRGNIISMTPSLSWL